MPKISILHLGNVLVDSSSGRIVERLMSDLGKEDFTWHIGGVCGLGDLQVEYEHLGVEVVDFSNHQNGSRFLPKRIRDYVFAHDIQIVHSHTPRARLASALALVAVHRKAHLATEHLLYEPRDRRWGLLYTLLDRSTLYPADHVVAVSQRMQRQLVALPGFHVKRVSAIQNAIDCASFFAPEQRDPCRSEFGLTSKSQVIGFTGRIDRVKRLNLLLEGFCEVVAQHPQARLMIIGEGKQRPELEVLASRLGINQAVIWTGFRQDIPRLLAAMDIYVQPSVNEGLSLSILEAMAAGKAVIATEVGGAQEVLTDQETGILIPPESSAAIRSAIGDLLSHPEKRTALAQAAKNYVFQEFDEQKMVEGYRLIYEALVKESEGSKF